MASARNKVIKGDYCDLPVYANSNSVNIGVFNVLQKINKTTVESYEVITEEQKKSGTSAVLRAGVGAVLLGGAGLLAGLSAKNKGIYVVAIQFKDGKRSLIEIDEKIYKKLIEVMF